MKKRSLILLCAVLLAFGTIDATPPWESPRKGVFTVQFVRNRGDVYPAFNKVRVKDMEKRYGDYPALIEWEAGDLDSIAYLFPSETVWLCGFQRYSTSFIDTVHVPAYQKMTWGELRKWFYWKVTRVKTGEAKYYPVTQGEDTTKVGLNIYLYGNYGWHEWLVTRIQDFHIPNDGSVWTVRLQAWETPPPDGKLYQESKIAVPMLHTNLNTAMDTMTYAMHATFRKTNDYLIDKSKEINLQLLRAYPHSIELLTNLMHIYTSEGNCDSLRWVAQQYVLSATKHLDTSDSLAAPWNTAGIAEQPGPYLDEIHKVLKAVCGDTTLWK